MEEKIKKCFSSNLLKFRKQLSLTQSQLAEKLNYSFQAVSKWEKGDSLPDIVTMKRIADFFHISVDDLIEEKNILILPKSRNKNHVLITLLSLGLNWFVITLIFAFTMIFSHGSSEYAWLLFIYGIPSMAIVLTVFSVLWFPTFMEIFSTSLLVWAICLAIFLSFPHPAIWLIFIIAAIFQLLIIFWFALRSNMKRVKDYL